MSNRSIFGQFECDRGRECDRSRECDRGRESDRGRDRGRGRGGHAVLNAGFGGTGPLPVITTLLTNPIPVVSVTLDADGLKDVNVLLNFTSIITIPSGAAVNLNFEVLRVRNDRTPVKIGPTFTFSRSAGVSGTESFGFQVFDANLEGDTYTYTVVLSTNTVITTGTGVTITNAVLSALAVEIENH